MKKNHTSSTCSCWLHLPLAWLPMKPSLLALLLAGLGLALPASAQTWILGSAWSAANGVGHLANSSNNRGLAYSAVSNQVFVATRNGAQRRH